VEKILILGCKKLMGDVCIACSRCMVAFNRREGAFARYKDQPAEMMGLLHCGDCPGVAVVNRMAQVKLWNAPLGEKPTKIHLGTCLVNYCPHKEEMIAKITAKAGVEVIAGGHTYMPSDIFK
jgi:predicted metal-binding protein